MLSHQEIKQLVQQNIDQIKISEFVTEGGWPNIDAVEIVVFSQLQTNDTTTIRLQILYTVSKAGCCFIPGKEEQMRLDKTVTIKNNQINII